MRMLCADGVKVYEVEREEAWTVVWPFMGGGTVEVRRGWLCGGRGRGSAPVLWQGRGFVGWQ